MATFKRGKIWWYEFIFAGRRIRESAKTTSKTVAKLAEQQRRRDLERGFNGLEDSRDERIRPIQDLAMDYLEEYRLRHKAVIFAEYALGNVTRHLGDMMAVDITEKTVKAYQTTRLKENAAPKTIVSVRPNPSLTSSGFLFPGEIGQLDSSRAGCGYRRLATELGVSQTKYRLERFQRARAAQAAGVRPASF